MDPAVEFHAPVLLAETLRGLNPQPGEVFFDGTLGGGGHAGEILRRILPDGFLYGTDQDPTALEQARKRLASIGDRFQLLPLNFVEALASAPIPPLDGILLDLGVSSHQLDTAERGFSFMKEGPLDMRMNPNAPVTAADLVNTLPEAELAEILWKWGEERFSRRIARIIVQKRSEKAFSTTLELADLIKGLMPWPGIHPATRTFQALRIAVNRELQVLEEAIPLAVDRLKPGGRLAIISFQSLEDRIVKSTFRRLATGCECPPRLPCVCGKKPVLKLLTGKPVVATPEEIEANPRARSAKLRVAQKEKA
ncbi:MAG: 16S rRNA (cytosine(1402)-N(4))-methyltransferase RsmH [Bacteroidota bacterium]